MAFLKSGHLFKNVVSLNKIQAKQFSVLTEYLTRGNPLLSPAKIEPCNRRDFIGYVEDKKDGYKTQKPVSQMEHIKYGLKNLKSELTLWKEEMKEHFRADPMFYCPPGLFCNGID